MTVKVDKPIWLLLHPSLQDKEKVISAYREGGSQKKAAKIMGCCEHTFQKAVKYHGIDIPLCIVPEHLNSIFNKVRHGKP